MIRFDFEYTGPGSPQHNGRVEKKFATLYGRVRAMLNGARLTQELRDGLWAEAANTTAEIDTIIISQNKKTPSYNLFYQCPMPGLKQLRPLGKMDFVEKHEERKIRGNPDDRVKPEVLFGRAVNYVEDVF